MIIKCPRCGLKISTNVDSCLNCGLATSRISLSSDLDICPAPENKTSLPEVVPPKPVPVVTETPIKPDKKNSYSLVNLLNTLLPRKPVAPQKPPEPRVFTFTETYTISGFKATIDDLRDYLEPGPDFDLCYEDIKEFYGIGAKIYEFTVRPSSMVVTLGEMENEKIPVFLNDKRSGYIGKKKSAELERFRTLYSIKGIYPRIDCGNYKKVMHNDDYDPDIDEPEEKKWVEWFGADDKIAAKIEVVIEKGR